MYSCVLQLCNVFCCQPPATQLPGICSPALRLFMPWMAPELMQSRIAAMVSTHDHLVYHLGPINMGPILVQISEIFGLVK